MTKDNITQYVTRRCHFKTWPPSIITIRTGPIITMRSVHEKKAIHIHSLENLSCPCNHELKFFQKYPRFNEAIWKFELPHYDELKFFQKWGSFDDVTWKFALPVLSQGKLFPKIKQFCWCDLEIWPAPIIANWNFCKNKEALMMSHENLLCPYYHEVNFSQKEKAVLLLWLENSACSYYHELKFLQKIRQFWLSNLKI